MTEKPFYTESICKCKIKFYFQEDAAKIILKILKKRIINVGGPTQTVYKFAKNIIKKFKNTQR